MPEKACPVQDVQPDQEEFITCPFAGESMCPQSNTCVLLLSICIIDDDFGDEDEDEDTAVNDN